MVVQVEQPARATTVDAVDLLDASFHNLTTTDVDETYSSNRLDDVNPQEDEDKKEDDYDEDFDAFAESKRLKEREEFQDSISSTKKEENKEEQQPALAKLEESMRESIESQLVVSDSQQAPNNSGSFEPKRFVSPKDFELMKVIGMGAFGKVLQVKNRKSGQILAMKVISKRLLKRKVCYVENIQAERNILTRVRHPFVVMMHASFQTKHKLFIIMDFLAGGELFLRLGREGIFLEKTAAFYLAEIILALDFLHNLGILHRDLKPENILLGSDGHICLTDFGLAKDFSEAGGFQSEADESRASTVCGTQEYMAPEMVAHKGYGRAADWWSLGCVAFEMLAGLPPFRSKLGAKDLFRKIMSEKVKMPDGASAAACKLLKGLLNRNPHARLGAARSTMFEVGGTSSLKKMDFFKHIEWDKLERKEVEPPERLPVKDERDLSHFHDEFTSMPLPRSVLMENKNDFNPRRIASENFRGFSFIQKDFLLPERDQAEIEKYWNSAEEDGESDSDNASSKFGEEPPPPAEPEKKKRPARKRKKKNKEADVKTPPTNSVAASSVASSESSIPNDPEEARDAITKKVPEVLAASTTDTTTSKEQVTTPTLHVTESVAIPNTSTNIVASQQLPKKPPEDLTWQSAKNTPEGKKKSKPLQLRPQHQPYSLDRSKNQKYAPPVVQRQPMGTPDYMQQQRQRSPPKSGGWAGSNLQHYQQIPKQDATGSWQVAHHHSYPQQGHGLARQPRPALQSAPKGPPPGSWAAKLQGSKAPSSAGSKPPSSAGSKPPSSAAPVQTRQQVPQSSWSDESVVSGVPPSPSSDWRQHTMSPSSKKAMISEPKLMGAWAARNK